ncbi:protein BREAST CANCER SUSCEPTIBILITY 1 homolog isoform X2 [Diospyros lotus]|uniref:protein BREAST CANCER SUSCEPTIBILITY 1 homolog isoform X2 n=1 Tax=Diospyros lotus TaxID=55363 RepID=UPI0022599042|nr:protein BREAST CANCER SUSCEPTIBILITY 1 homolog isoform X2 [Diospyros lotus]
MADYSQLERMGRELKCPICLSLLNSAVSLSCNHVFCNPCIEKSMKSASSCPVCKVPYGRREVRPAPHMDNLVSIYKNMEEASGANIFVTQNAPSNKISDGSDQAGNGRNRGREKIDRRSQQTDRKQGSFKRMCSKPALKTSQENSDLDPAKPSFPTKKRVQLPQYPPSRTAEQQTTSKSRSSGIAEVQPPKNSDVLTEKIAVKEKGELAFTPFFWLRDDEDVEKLSQQTDGDQNMDTPLIDAPCFSDIKDSDDETLSQRGQNGGGNTTSDNADYFESEMFEWTQRPCSPELCSSPMKIQADTDEYNTIQVKECNLSLQTKPTTGKYGTENTENVFPKQKTNDAEASLAGLSSSGINTTNIDNRIKKSNKCGRKVSVRTKRKQAKRPIDEVRGVQADPNKVVEGAASEKKCHDNINLLNLKEKTHRRVKKVMCENVAVRCLQENVSALSIGKNSLNGNNRTISELPAALDCSSMETNDQKQRDCPKGSKINTTNNTQCDQKLSNSKRQKVFNDDILKDNSLVNSIQYGSNMVSEKSTQPSYNSQVRVLQNSAAEKALPDSFRLLLHKCENVPSKIECAFCHSTEESQASGVMVHYLNGKPVAADYSGGQKIIHAHRNCVEWAPNVYFEDDIAINLDAELSRSRRIKCCCCDIRGAALGCYEKSCRKSFHVPCAKLIQQCRWDNDNFVMLCPIHSSSKLPNEISASQIKRKQKCTSKRPSQSHQPEVASKDGSTGQQWNSHGLSSRKLILCCSALTSEEKEIVSKFERLSGVMVLKNWNSRVTHVVASTDENGACRRTLKILMGILEGKWILSIEWIKVCMKAMEPVNEQPYEIALDIHGIRDGPRLGRLRVLNKQPNLFEKCEFYFTGEFAPSYKGYLHDLIIAAGGAVLQRKPISSVQEFASSGKKTSSTFIIFSLELPDKCDPDQKNSILKLRRLDAEALASSTRATVASNSWILDSIAACKLQNLAEY